MAKVITTELQHSGASGANITLDSSKNVTCENNLQVDGNVTVTGTLPADKLTGALPAISGASLTGISSPLSFRNVIQNGTAAVAQRHTTKASITGAEWIVDRFKFDAGSIGTYTVSQDSSGPPGFANSMKVLLTSAATPSAASLAQIMISLEGQDLQHFCKGTSSAKKFALSFWVKAKVTGTYVCELYDQDNTRQTSKQYSISAADTWEKKTVIFEADTTGAFDDDNAKSLVVFWKLVAGSNWNSGTLQTSWAANNNANRAVGQVNGMATNNDYFQLTGVQLEAGDTATDFEHRSYAEELARCQRYFWQLIDYNNTSIAIGSFYSGSDLMWVNHHPVTMRASPSIRSNVNGAGSFIIGRWYNGSGGTNGSGNLSIQRVNKNTILVYSNGWSCPGLGAVSLESNTSSCYLGYEAEL